uniref:Uncharacterized protein n=1 Tax=Pseudomonas phage HRDY3 TaxID=3236930 RepID=A0AB39CDL2_9VIRU
MAHFTGISYGPEISLQQLAQVQAARNSYRNANEMLRDHEHVARVGQWVYNEQKEKALKILQPYLDRAGANGPQNNVCICFHGIANNSSSPSRDLMAHVPPIFLVPAMLPRLYDIVAVHCEPGEFVHSIEFL